MFAITFQTLFYKEVLRFLKVATQTITAPIVTALLYLLIFGHALEDYVQIYPGVSYTAFLVPGLVMMSLLQNAFANSSSSLIQSKINGSLVFVLLSPVSHWQLYLAYMLAAVARGIIVGVGVFAVLGDFDDRRGGSGDEQVFADVLFFQRPQPLHFGGDGRTAAYRLLRERRHPEGDVVAVGKGVFHGVFAVVVCIPREDVLYGVEVMRGGAAGKGPDAARG